MHDGGVAAADGRLQKGDEILSVNDVSLAALTHSEAVETLKVLPGTDRKRKDKQEAEDVIL